MASELLIIKNITREGPGIAGELIEAAGIPSVTIDLCRGEEPPPAGSYRAVLVLGGPDSANDTGDKMEKELSFIRSVIDSGTPYLGICLGLQTLVKAGGGKVVKNPVKEVGFREADNELYRVNLTPEGRKDPLFEGLDDTFTVFHLHGETVVPTSEMTVLATGRSCLNQVVRVRPLAYGIQCHFELTPALFKTWVEEDPDLRQLDSNLLWSDFNMLRESYTETGIKLFTNFLRLAGFSIRDGSM